jgi:hypothetical protein
MRGALLSLVAFVVVGLAPAAHASGNTALVAQTVLAGEAPSCALEGQACEAPASVSDNDASVEHRQELASPAEIGCALVFRNTSAVDHGAALRFHGAVPHFPAASPADVRLWSCDESALRVFNAWYRVSRFPEAETSHALSLHANGPLVGHTNTQVVASLTDGRAPDHRAPPTFEQSVGILGRAGLVCPQPQHFSYHEGHRLLVERSLAPPERPPRHASLA